MLLCASDVPNNTLQDSQGSKRAASRSGTGIAFLAGGVVPGASGRSLTVSAPRYEQFLARMITDCALDLRRLSFTDHYQP